MRRSSRYRHPSPLQLLRRFDRIAGQINPYLVAVAIGLAIIDLVCLVLLAPYLGVTRHPPGDAACPAGVAAAGDAASPVPRLPAVGR
jgi:hypothetical protein